MNQVTEHDRIATAVCGGLQQKLEQGTLILTPTVAEVLKARLLEIQTAAGRLEASLAGHRYGRRFAQLMLEIREITAGARELVDESMAEQRTLPL